MSEWAKREAGRQLYHAARTAMRHGVTWADYARMCKEAWVEAHHEALEHAEANVRDGTIKTTETP